MPRLAMSPDGTRLAYEVHGSGSPALVLVHGWCCHRGYWKDQVAPLAARAAVVTVDLAGHGESGTTRRDWSLAAFGADVASVVDELGLEKVVLVGHSMGADVILHAARRLEPRVLGLIWVDEYSQLFRLRSESQVRERVAPFRADFVRATRTFVRGLFPPSAEPSLVERVATGMASAPPSIALAALEATWNHARDVPSLLAELGLPVIAINAQSSGTDVEDMRRHGVDVVVMPEVGHFPMLERPDEFNACLSNIHERLSRGA
jgi:sigma-B regulation protein RsbQ